MSVNQNEFPEWNVYISNINKMKIESYNIFNHYTFRKDCEEAYEKYKDNIDEFANAVENSLAYFFHYKCEWEIILLDFPPCERFKNEKVDVYHQVKLNWQMFISYLWSFYYVAHRKAVKHE